MPDPVFGALTALLKANAQFQAAQGQAQLALAARKEELEGDIKAELLGRKSEAAAAQGQGSAEPDLLQILAAVGPQETPLQAGQTDLPPQSIAQAAAGRTAAGATQGGAAVQTLAKGGAPGAPTVLGASVPQQITTRQQSTRLLPAGENQFERSFLPVTETTQTTQPNVLTAAQAAQLQFQQQQAEQAARVERDRTRADLGLRLAGALPGAKPGAISAAATALVEGDVQTAFEAVGGDFNKLAIAQEQQRQLGLRKLRAEINATEVRTQVDRLRLKESVQQTPLSAIAGLPTLGAGPGGEPLTSNQVLQRLQDVFNEDSEIRPDRIGTLQAVQGALLNQGTALLVREVALGDDKTVTFPAGPIIEAATLAAGVGDQAKEAQAALLAAQSPDGERLYKRVGGEIVPAVPKKDVANYSLLDGMLAVGEAYQDAGQKAKVFPVPVEQPPDPLERVDDQIRRAEQALEQLPQPQRGATFGGLIPTGPTPQQRRVIQQRKAVESQLDDLRELREELANRTRGKDLIEAEAELETFFTDMAQEIRKLRTELGR